LSNSLCIIIPRVNNAAPLRLSQHSLGDFADCPRRYYLRYIAQQAWPLVEASPTGGLTALQYREYLRKGALLHRWIERHWLGIDETPQTDDPELQTWWARFLSADFSHLPATRTPELELTAPLGEASLYARFDLLACQPGQAVIVDWKTLRGETAPSYQMLKRRIQTRAYLYVLATAGAPFNEGHPFEPEQCAMRYWLANFPDRAWVEITYSRAEYEADKAMLSGLVDEISRGQTIEDFPKTSDERKCRYCEYRTLCHRLGAPGAITPEFDPEAALDGEVGELEY